MNEYDPIRVQKIQQRIDSALRESHQDRLQSRFSPYISDSRPDLDNQLASAAASSSCEGVDAMEAVLDEFERLATKEDRGRLRHALLVFLTHDSRVAKLGLRVPSLEERSPWKLAPSKKRTEKNNNDKDNYDDET
ncbi:MAG: hypothetical protein M3115_01050 [Thermoproteota archaeon]|nr:hypothetical protein [Thermoproteota archaeon]